MSLFLKKHVVCYVYVFKFCEVTDFRHTNWLFVKVVFGSVQIKMFCILRTIKSFA